MKVIKAVASPLLSVLGMMKPPSLKAPPAGRPPSRDEAREEADKRNELARRRGGAADIVSGPYGAEAGAGGKTTLGS